MKSRFFLCICFLFSANTTVAANYVVTDFPLWLFPSPKIKTIPLDPSAVAEGDRWVKKNPLAEHEFSDPIKAEKDRNLLDPGFFGGYHRAVINNMEYWVIAVSEINVISITNMPITKIHFKILYMGTWREITSLDDEYKRLLRECRMLDI